MKMPSIFPLRGTNYGSSPIKHFFDESTSTVEAIDLSPQLGMSTEREWPVPCPVALPWGQVLSDLI